MNQIGVMRPDTGKSLVLKGFAGVRREREGASCAGTRGPRRRPGSALPGLSRINTQWCNRSCRCPALGWQRDYLSGVPASLRSPPACRPDASPHLHSGARWQIGCAGVPKNCVYASMKPRSPSFPLLRRIADEIDRHRDDIAEAEAEDVQRFLDAPEDAQRLCLRVAPVWRRCLREPWDLRPGRVPL